MKIGYFANSSQMIGSKEFKFSVFDEGHPGVVIRKFGKDQNKALPVGPFPHKFSGCDHNSKLE